MADSVMTIGERQLLICEPDGEKLASEADALELIGDAIYFGVDLVVVPVQRFEATFFQLKTGLAGQILQKFVNYKYSLVVLGDISQHLAESRAFRDFVYEANHGNQIWFLNNLQELEARLNRQLLK